MCYVSVCWVWLNVLVVMFEEYKLFGIWGSD